MSPGNIPIILTSVFITFPTVKLNVVINVTIVLVYNTCMPISDNTIKNNILNNIFYNRGRNFFVLIIFYTRLYLYY